MVSVAPEHFVMIETDHTGRARNSIADDVIQFKTTNGKIERVGHVTVKFALQNLMPAAASSSSSSLNTAVIPLGGDSNLGVAIPLTGDVNGGELLNWQSRQSLWLKCFMVLAAGVLKFTQLLYGAHLMFNWYKAFVYSGESAGLNYWVQIGYFLAYMSVFAGSIMWWEYKLDISETVEKIKMHAMKLKSHGGMVNYLDGIALHHTLLVHKGVYRKLYKAVRTLIFYGFGAMIIAALTQSSVPELRDSFSWLTNFIMASVRKGIGETMPVNTNDPYTYPGGNNMRASSQQPQYNF